MCTCGTVYRRDLCTGEASVLWTRLLTGYEYHVPVYWRDLCTDGTCVPTGHVYQRDVCTGGTCVPTGRMYRRDVYQRDVCTAPSQPSVPGGVRRGWGV